MLLFSRSGPVAAQIQRFEEKNKYSLKTLHMCGWAGPVHGWVGSRI